MARFESITRTSHGWRIEGDKNARRVMEGLAREIDTLRDVLGDDYRRLFPLNRPQRLFALRQELRMTMVEVHGRVKRIDYDIRQADWLRAVRNVQGLAMIDCWDLLDDKTHPDHTRYANISTRWHDRLFYLGWRDRQDNIAINKEYRVNMQRSVAHHLCPAGVTVAGYRERKALFATPRTLMTPDGRNWTVNHWINIRAGVGAEYERSNGKGNAAKRRRKNDPSEAETLRMERIAKRAQRLEEEAALQVEIDALIDMNNRQLEQWFATITLAED